MIPGDQIHWAASAAENLGDLPHLDTIHSVVLEGVAGYHHKIHLLAEGFLHDAPRRLQACVAYPFAFVAQLGGAHPDLPVCRVQELHFVISNSKFPA
jgi:hypothetical protein